MIIPRGSDTGLFQYKMSDFTVRISRILDSKRFSIATKRDDVASRIQQSCLTTLLDEMFG